MVSSAPRGGAGEQPHAEVPLQRGDALGDGLLGDRQLGGGLLELARFRGGDEGPDGVEIHGHLAYTSYGIQPLVVRGRPRVV